MLCMLAACGGGNGSGSSSSSSSSGGSSGNCDFIFAHAAICSSALQFFLKYTLQLLSSTHCNFSSSPLFFQQQALQYGRTYRMH